MIFISNNKCQKSGHLQTTFSPECLHSCWLIIQNMGQPHFCLPHIHKHKCTHPHTSISPENVKDNFSFLIVIGANGFSRHTL